MGGNEADRRVQVRRSDAVGARPWLFGQRYSPGSRPPARTHARTHTRAHAYTYRLRCPVSYGIGRTPSTHGAARSEARTGQRQSRPVRCVQTTPAHRFARTDAAGAFGRMDVGCGEHAPSSGKPDRIGRATARSVVHCVPCPYIASVRTAPHRQRRARTPALTSSTPRAQRGGAVRVEAWLGRCPSPAKASWTRRR